MGELGVDNAGRLHDGGARLQPDGAYAVVVELDPAAKHVDELEVQRVAVSLARLGRCAACADHMCADVSGGGGRDAEVAVGEKAPQSVVPARVARVADGEAPLARRVVLV